MSAFDEEIEIKISHRYKIISKIIKSNL
ncbi:hypothetical protein SASC598J21_001710, partial [Snodgrassella alvi SCGC AB-598-J21]